MQPRRSITASCIVVLSVFHGSSSAANSSTLVGPFDQEIALYRQRQDGLPSLAVSSVLGDMAGSVVVKTDVGWSKWDGQRWVSISPPHKHNLESPPSSRINQIAESKDARTAIAAADGLFESARAGQWRRLTVDDGLGRIWAAADVRGVAYDAKGRLWFATRAGVGCRDQAGKWRFFEGKDGLPYNDFNCAAAGPNGEVWFGTSRGAIRFSDGIWAYRQGLRWLPDDDVRAIHVGQDGTAWFATARGVGCIARKSMTLQEKASFYEEEIDRFLKRTEFGYVSSGRLDSPGSKSKVTLADSDNDGLWTAMYGASQCFASAVTNSELSRKRAKQAFEALRFLQVVTQNAEPSPPLGFVARTVLPTGGRNPNEGRLPRDLLFRQTRDRLWKVYEPRWPKSQDGRWYWKSDTSSDELDGHYFFYALYLDLVANTESEKARVREVVRNLTDHLIEHDFVLQDHDGKPTRWAVYRPSSLNGDFHWYQERGLNSLSMLSYLAVAHHVTGEKRYEDVARKLREDHHYDANLMVPKMQRGMGSGNQSDDEMAFMAFYNLVKYTTDESLRKQYLAAFFGYWMLEQPERNPFFHFAYAAFGQGETLQGTFGEQSLSPWGNWLADSIATLKGFPLDRMNWAHANSHRLDVLALPPQQAVDYLSSSEAGDSQPTRGYRVDGRVLPVEERHFAHWNTDPWRLDYEGDGRTLACGSVFLLPYYLGRFHRIIE